MDNLLTRLDKAAVSENPLSALKKEKAKKKEIEYGMTTDEIAEIISDRMMDVIKKQFAETEAKLKAASE
jgi:hypothetical protein